MGATPRQSGTETDILSIAPASYRVDTLSHFGRRTMMRVRAPSHCGERTYLLLNPDFWIGCADMSYTGPAVESVASTGIIKVHIRLSGASLVGGAHEKAHTVGPMSCGALIHQRDEIKLERFEAQVEERSVTVACTARFLREEHGLNSHGLHSRIAQFASGIERPLAEIQVPLLLESRLDAEAIFAGLSQTGAHPMMIEARALSLLARFLDQARNLEENNTRRAVLAHDRRIAEAARAILDERLSDPPPMKELAGAVGTHTAKLMRLFKATQGSTISEYLDKLRMERALTLINEGELSITQISFEVGYEHPSNFATAFKRHFGISPRSARSAGGLQPYQKVPDVNGRSQRQCNRHAAIEGTPSRPA